MDKKSYINFDELTDEQLVRGVELLVEPDELKERGVLMAILKALDFQAQDVLEQIKLGEPLNAGPALSLNF